jgi:hypothetical protein
MEKSPRRHSLKMLEFAPESLSQIYVNGPVEEADEWSSQGKSESLDKVSIGSYTKTPV